ncbi:hypothetical protein [Ruegeria sp. EL01]|uniref:hypothetical protein n=1 Tax=Ruegeria sp. EL01 TaxID=2107578 RepID=UPI0013C50FF2|nr:hypothetical protein [Ruegeria sp. EL01]
MLWLRFTIHTANAGPASFNAVAGAVRWGKGAVSTGIASERVALIAAEGALVAPLNAALRVAPAVHQSARTNAPLALIAPVAVSATGAANANVSHPSLTHALLQNVQMG